MSRKLTARQAEIYEFMVYTLVEDQFVPGPRQIAKEFGFNGNAAHHHLNALEAKGYVVRYLPEDAKYRRCYLPKITLGINK